MTLKGTPKTDEHRKNISISLTGKEHPWQDKINRNPEKIRKTAEKHRGMKRSDKAKENMSLAKKGKEPNNKGMICIHNINTFEVRTINPSEEIPDNWKRGTGPRKSKV